uniref:Putative ovule protein n=1 Tax=Solanum chacoense TaxID=4108 RepID=A0A0V0HG63_SOLCH
MVEEDKENCIVWTASNILSEAAMIFSHKQADNCEENSPWKCYGIPKRLSCGLFWVDCHQRVLFNPR